VHDHWTGRLFTDEAIKAINRTLRTEPETT
jgi:hypothetical protein